MTRTVDIDFTFKSAVEPSSVVGRLVSSGMTADVGGKISYLLDLDGMFDWGNADSSELDQVISLMGDRRWGDGHVGITLLFAGSTRGGDLLFQPGRTVVSFSITVNPKYLQNSSKFCDLGWYLAALIPLFEPLGLTEVEARDVP
ncbi:hypothetical protein [Streptomyces sp. NBC_00687]|uniref:hypothetical protein n=1 Tax=Streptomyces sp. NBC_00687 TaxID=2975807 RepID=UPI002259F6F5|nr:hypothetical protein [Streptomyces sp. NBC_00687]MCX4920201.1 hypothetical protein [Streptomyces sp. NBC_00687]